MSGGVLTNEFIFALKKGPMVKCVLIDDEFNAIKALMLELRNFSDRVEIVGQYTQAESALDFLSTNAVDVVFLDIEMPEMSGLEFLKRFQNRDFEVVFTTAYSKYAHKAIQNEAVYYLLKPIDIGELEVCIERIEKKLSKDLFENKLDYALEQLSQISGFPKKIKIPVDGKITFYDPDDILYGEGDGNYCNIFFSKGSKVLLSKKLKLVEEILTEPIFYRVHNSYIVNLNKIKAYNKNEGVLIMENNIIIPVSRNKRSEILDKF